MGTVPGSTPHVYGVQGNAPDGVAGRISTPTIVANANPIAARRRDAKPTSLDTCPSLGEPSYELSVHGRLTRVMAHRSTRARHLRRIAHGVRRCVDGRCWTRTSDPHGVSV